jgi:hypothetical protein
MISTAARATVVAVAMVAAAGSLYAARRPARPVAPAVAPLAVEQTQATTPKADRLPTEFTDRVLVPPPVQEVQQVQEGRRTAGYRKREPNNVCTRHGMHKVTIGRNWRCRR